MLQEEEETHQGCGYPKKRSFEAHQGGSNLQDKKRGLRKNKPHCHLDPGIPASRTVRKTFLLLNLPRLWYSVTGVLAKTVIC